MRARHEQLLAKERELVIPVHYKKLLDILKYLDNSLNFLKSCRRQTSCSFDELKKSIEKTNGKQFELESFKQILFLLPESYIHSWNFLWGRTSLMIDFPDEEKQISQQKMEQRQSLLKKTLIEETIKHYSKFVREMSELDQNDPILRIDPLKSKMWHNKFEVHQVPPIPMADLKP